MSLQKILNIGAVFLLKENHRDGSYLEKCICILFQPQFLESFKLSLEEIHLSFPLG